MSNTNTSNNTSTATIRHAIHWFEIPVSNLARSIAFYGRLLGVDLKQEQFGGGQLAIFPADPENGVKGCLIQADHVPPHTDGVLIYLDAGPAMDPVLARLEACGGRLLTPRTELPEGMGCFAHFADPDGQRIGLHSLA